MHLEIKKRRYNRSIKYKILVFFNQYDNISDSRNNFKDIILKIRNDSSFEKRIKK